jgi:competence protein ComEA
MRQSKPSILRCRSPMACTCTFRCETRVNTAPPVISVPAGPSNPVGATGTLININTATLEELDTLPGIGPSTAQKIIDHRTTHGPFLTIEAVLDVPGIGPVKFEQIKALITIG